MVSSARSKMFTRFDLSAVLTIFAAVEDSTDFCAKYIKTFGPCSKVTRSRRGRDLDR